MKTLHELSKEIQQHPDRKNELLASFRTNESDIRHFLFSLQEVDAYIVPALLETFAVKWRGSEQPGVIKDFIDKHNTNLVVELDVNMAVKNVF